MPESKCWDCKITMWKPTDETLRTWELQHLINSATINTVGEKLHKCRSFEVYDEGSQPVGYREYTTMTPW